ncbi:response regulator [Myxosarcina sp. GI1]|uniref:response regulator n=1 Tax=Myxosarcina sp. GI1 TaxID=1541065 RepID=UPI0006897021|nr:response regulator [Myxosarcina sp. GI1]
MITILLVDDQKMIREALKTALETEEDFQILGVADNGFTAIEKVKELKPNIVLMNVEMPGINGIDAAKIITGKFPHTKILIFSSYDNEEYITKSLAIGAKGYLLKDTSFQDIAAAIRSVDKGYTQIGSGLLEKLLIQTDSGVILSKLNSRSYLNNVATLSEKKQTSDRATNAILRLQSLTREQAIEQAKLRQRLNELYLNVPKLQTELSSYSRKTWQTWFLLLTSIPIIALVLFGLYLRINNLEKKSIPLERVGLYGKLDLSGLAQRVVRAFEQDLELASISDVYVAQKGSTVILKGTISNLYLLNRMKDIAKNVEGVTSVDTSSVEIRSNLPGEAL